ncbi:MAG: hypothetical protein WBC29_02195, partial [Candidatus Moraniibacteriota bacterium]
NSLIVQQKHRVNKQLEMERSQSEQVPAEAGLESEHTASRICPSIRGASSRMIGRILLYEEKRVFPEDKRSNLS